MILASIVGCTNPIMDEFCPGQVGVAIFISFFVARFFPNPVITSTPSFGYRAFFI